MKKTGKCMLTGKELPLNDLVNVDSIRPQIRDLIKKSYPDWSGDTGFISVDQLNIFRNEYIQNMITEENGELNQLDLQVLESIRNKELLSTRLDSDVREKSTLGQRIADKIALFGGSWKFIISFALVLLSWILVNSYLLLRKPFDPYPFILLNLMLSCLAAIQAPVIMMSQNRQEVKDRARAQNDYQVNLKAEIEIRQLHEKIDHILINQSKRLFEIQEIQVELMEQIISINKK
jgi:uncharacterized membrane protein